MGLSTIDFKTLLIAGLIVSTGIYLVSESSSEAAWLLTFVILLGIAFSDPNFSTQLLAVVGGKPLSIPIPPGQIAPGQSGPLPTHP